MDTVLTKEFGENKRVRVCSDYDGCDDPRSWDNVAHFICRHGRYKLGDNDNIEGELQKLADKFKVDIEGLNFLQVIKALNDYCVIKPISMYEHSGCTVFFGAPTDPWDSGYIGFGYVTFEDIDGPNCGRNAKDYPDWRDQAEEIMDGEMDTYDRYVRGEVYGYFVEEYDADEGEWNETGSCWGFYMEPEEVANEAIADNTPREPQPEPKPKKFIPIQLEFDFDFA
jgi:hypothetical protein